MEIAENREILIHLHISFFGLADKFSQKGYKMTGRLLAKWAQKQERIEDEMISLQKKLVTLKRQQKKLVTDIWLLVIAFPIIIYVLLALASMIDFIPWVFIYFYGPILAALAIFMIGWNILRLAKKIALLCHHKRKDLPFEYPKPPILNSNYPTYIPPNYYTEQLCIEWLMEKYGYEMVQLKKLRKEIEQAPEEDYDKLQEKLNEIIIYEIIGRAKYDPKW